MPSDGPPMHTRQFCNDISAGGLLHRLRHDSPQATSGSPNRALDLQSWQSSRPDTLFIYSSIYIEFA
jgi:hypothetical protein